jgi:hypothetical protein
VKARVDPLSKCTTCVGKLEYKTAIPCRYCKWNIEPYWGRDETKMTKDYYKQVKQATKADNIPY